MNGETIEWLRYAGIKEDVCQGCGTEAWCLFTEIVIEDCKKNPFEPGKVAISVKRLMEWYGLREKEVLKALKYLKDHGYIGVFVPDNEYEDCIFRVVTPLDTPVPLEDIRADNGITGPCRYADRPAAKEKKEGREGTLEWLVGKWLGANAGAISPILVDKLRWIADNYDQAEIQKAWEAVEQWKRGMRIGFLMEELIRERRAREKCEVGTRKSERGSRKGAMR